MSQGLPKAKWHRSVGPYKQSCLQPDLQGPGQQKFTVRSIRLNHVKKCKSTEYSLYLRDSLPGPGRTARTLHPTSVSLRLGQRHW